LKHGILERSHAASAILVPKANGERRLCVDYRALNAGIQPGIEEKDGINEYQRPCNKTKVRRFVEIAGFFRKFVKEYRSTRSGTGVSTT